MARWRSRTLGPREMCGLAVDAAPSKDAGTGPAPVVSVQGVSKGFTSGGRRVEALAEVEAVVQPGMVTGLIGPDAAGKTTLMRILCGLLEPDTGRAEVLGHDTMAGAGAIQAQVGYMPQRFGLYEDLSVRQNLDLYADLKGLAPQDRPERYAELMHMTGLELYQARLAGDLSGGMKQKLGLACALAGPAELLILDEPTVGVDPLSRRELWAIVYHLVEKQGLSVLLSTSYLDEAERCKRVILMHSGRVLGQGGPGEFSAEMAGRSFMVRAQGRGRRKLQRRLARSPGVIDAVLSGSGVRVVMEAGAEPDPSAMAEEGDSERAEAVAPRFEDSFIARMRARREVQAGPEAEPETGGREHQAGEVIAVKDLVRRFGDFEAVRGISFSVEAGEIFGLLGANGAGKTTTFRMLCGLLPISGGSLTVAGLDLRRAAAKARGRIGYMAQRFSLYADLTVRENLTFFSAAYGLAGRRQKERIEWAVHEFGLAEAADAASGELPLGYKQRLALAVALMHEPDILFLDEPTSGVDPLARREFWRRINLLAESGVTVLVTTHFMEEAEYCDRLVIMERGRILAGGAPAELKRRFAGEGGEEPSMEQAFIALIEQHREQAA